MFVVPAPRNALTSPTPIFTPNACEGTTTLFETEYFGDKAYLTQSGQLYMEAAAAAFGKVYCFGPTFRAENSNTSRHLAEFWMIEPEMSFYDIHDNMDLAERFLKRIFGDVLAKCPEDMEFFNLRIDKTVLETLQPRTFAQAMSPARAQQLQDMMVAVVSRGTGFLRTLVLAAALGGSLVGNAYTTAQIFPGMVYEFLLGGILTSSEDGSPIFGLVRVKRKFEKKEKLVVMTTGNL